MSASTHRATRPTPGQRPPARRPDRAVAIVAAVVVAVVVVALVAALIAGSNDDDGGVDTATRSGDTSSSGDADTADDAGSRFTDAAVPDDTPAIVEGTPLPQLTDGGADPAIGAPMPTLTGAGLDGQRLTLPAEGRPAIVVFLAHWCPHCQREVPEIVELMKDGELDGVRVVGVLTGTDRTAPNHPPVRWLEREDWQGEIMLDDEHQSAAEAFGLTSYPFAVYLDADGQVVARTAGSQGRSTILQLATLIQGEG